MIYLVVKDLLIQRKSFFFLLFIGIFIFIIYNNQAFDAFIYIMGSILHSRNIIPIMLKKPNK